MKSRVVWRGIFQLVIGLWLLGLILFLSFVLCAWYLDRCRGNWPWR